VLPNAVNSLKCQSTLIPQIGIQFHAAGKRLRVNVQLIDAESGKHLWAERVEKPIADLFDMQDEIVSRLAQALDAQLVLAEARRAERLRNPDVLDLVFQGLACVYKGPTPEHLTQARGFFERVLAIDPRNVGALVGIASVDATLGAYALTDDRSARLSTAEANAIRALSLDPDRAVAHRVLGTIYNMTNRSARGIAECEQALALDRNLADAHAVIGMAKYYLGRAAETEGHILEAFLHSPRDIFAHRWCSSRAWPRSSSVRMPKPLFGCNEALRRTAILHSRILYSPLRWVCRAHWMRLERLRPRD
jgi:tetratricopeptide (TPR) repeat protein